MSFRDWGPSEVADMARVWDDPYNPEWFLTPTERGLIDLYKRRPVRMKRFARDFQWVSAELKKRGVEL